MAKVQAWIWYVHMHSPMHVWSANSSNMAIFDRSLVPLRYPEKNGESNLADVIVDSPLIRLLTALRFDPNTDPLSSFQQMGP